MIDKDLKDVTFEHAIEELELIVEELESNTLPLDRALELFQKGIVLMKHCNIKLEEAEGTVEILLKDADGNLNEMPFAAGKQENDDEI
ncbi:MAG: exodeoxyribonuclease VII small subunit [Clostridiales bacterium]|nr:exodeoxyribonuclease VII small subunit [Clostridiales bacterium]